MGHIERLRIATIVLLFLVEIFTLAFVISASMALHTSYGMTKITESWPSRDIAYTTLSLQSLTNCPLGDEETQSCFTMQLSSQDAQALFRQYGDTCPISAGNWVIAAQSLTMFLLLWPIIALIKQNWAVRFKRATVLIFLSLATVLALTAIGVWHLQCVSGFDRHECDEDVCEGKFNIKGEPSGAFAFQCIIMVVLLASTICTFVYQFAAKKQAENRPLLSPIPSDHDAYYHAY